MAQPLRVLGSLAHLVSLVAGTRTAFTVNCSGLRYEQALQAAVAQGLLNRKNGAHVWLSDIAEGLGDYGQKDGAGFPGMKFIEWKTGHGGGPWYEPESRCRTCAGLRERWMRTVEQAAGVSFVAITFQQLMEEALPLLRWRVLYRPEELHSLGPVLTLAGVASALPVTTLHDPLPSLPLLFDTSGLWADAVAATRFTTERLLHRTNTSAFAVQAPTCLPYLADAIVDYSMAVFWLPDMCSTADAQTKAQHAAMQELVEGSGHFNATRSLYYMGWYNNTRQSNPELLEECTALHRLITLASDQSDNLSFLSKLPGISQESDRLEQPAMWQGGQPRSYSPLQAYVAVLVSDGDNIAEDWSTLRPMLEERVQRGSRVPVSWTISNRWMHWGAPVLRWAYAEAAKTGVDSFLMGPSGYGYLFPGNMTRADDKDAFARETISAAQLLDIQGYVHWDVDVFLDKATTARTIDYLQRFNGSIISGAFMLGSDPLDGRWPDEKPYDSPGFVGSLAAFKPIYQYGPPNATTAAAAINAVPPGSMVYVYLTLGTDMNVVDEVARLKASHIELVGYRELIELAQQKRLAEQGAVLFT